MSRETTMEGWGWAQGTSGRSRVRHYFALRQYDDGPYLLARCREWALRRQDVTFASDGARCRVCAERVARRA
jgi:hypothetical protein